MTEHSTTKSWLHASGCQTEGNFVKAHSTCNGALGYLTKVTFSEHVWLLWTACCILAFWLSGDFGGYLQRIKTGPNLFFVKFTFPFLYVTTRQLSFAQYLIDEIQHFDEAWVTLKVSRGTAHLSRLTQCILAHWRIEKINKLQ